MKLILNESNSPFWLIGAGKNGTFAGSSTNIPCYYKSRRKQEEIANQIFKNDHNVEEVYLLTGTQWDNMPSGSKEEYGYIKNKGKLILSKNQITEGEYPKGVSRDPLPKKGAKVYTSPATALENKEKNKIKLELKQENNVSVDNIPKDFKNKYSTAYSLGDVVKFIHAGNKLSDETAIITGYDDEGFYKVKWSDGEESEGLHDKNLKLVSKSDLKESKIVTPVGNPQTAGSFVNIDVDLDHVEVSDFIVRLAQAIRSEQTAVLEYVALMSSNGITNEDRDVIKGVMEEEKNHMCALTTLLYKQILMNHKENVDEANDEFTLPKFGVDLFDENNKLTESVDTILTKVMAVAKESIMTADDLINELKTDTNYDEIAYHIHEYSKIDKNKAMELMDLLFELEDNKSPKECRDEIISCLITTEDVKVSFNGETMSQEQWDVVVDVDYDADFQLQVVNNLTNAIQAMNPETFKSEHYAIAEDKYTLAGDKFNFVILTYSGFNKGINETFVEEVCDKLFEKATTYEYYIKRA